MPTRVRHPTMLLLCLAIGATACTGPSDQTGPASAEQQARLNGRRLYLANCTPCHGENADGHGPQREVLDPPPRDYTNPTWRATATPSSVFEAISQGVPGTAMPAWNLLPEAEIRDLTAYVLSVAEHDPTVDGEAPEASRSSP